MGPGTLSATESHGLLRSTGLGVRQPPGTHPADVQVTQAQRGQAHDDGLDVQLARKDGHVQRHEGLGSQGPQLGVRMEGGSTG